MKQNKKIKKIKKRKRNVNYSLMHPNHVLKPVVM